MAGLDQKTLAEIKALSVPERIEAVNLIWESIPENHKASEVSESEKRILDFSIEHSEKYPEDKISWEDLKAELHAKINTAR